MSLFKKYIVDLARYNIWAYQQLLKSCESLTDEQYRAPSQMVFRSIHGQLNHLLLADLQWYRRLVFQQDTDEARRVASFFVEGTYGFAQDSPEIKCESFIVDREKLSQELLGQANKFLKRVEEYSEDELAGNLVYHRSNGANMEMPLAQILLHVVNHATHHRGQTTIAGPHDAVFYKILDELHAEYDALLDSGYRGVGFDAPGQRVGTGVSHNVPEYIARKRAIEVAELRKRRQKIMAPAGGVKLGGGAMSRKLGLSSKALEQMLSPRELAAASAERRLRDMKWCGSEDYDDNQATAASSKRPTETLNGSLSTKKPKPIENNIYASWECSHCTFLNQPRFPCCDMCGSERPNSDQQATPTQSQTKNSKSIVSQKEPIVLESKGKDKQLTDGIWHEDGSLVFENVWICPKCFGDNQTAYRMCHKCQYLRAL
ncbi:hypothetical protein SmJEL517_g05640 [Synchytrium microbalum]|uniref:RanBP2-type domain-containing protein n=1 Tax=Synchytrium microbalum TaxID=1806994 RepID=A0A507BMV0_9FUNG|nr:uncharacterized protein SmJEL517_g05640 [Synchytrium microbalum]TPX30897.1 hypothetical protein SmJEL517_g05640 [Synchytrium microbalum]